MNVLVIGAKGFIGQELCRVLSERGHKVLAGVRKRSLENEIEIPLFGTIKVPRDCIPEIVVDVSNKYIPTETEANILAMSQTILGVSETIRQSNIIWNAQIFQTTSYLQYCPENLQPWNSYAALRNQSLSELRKSAEDNGSGLYEFVLHDTYGDSPRSKFLDLCLNAINSGKPFPAGEGNSILNLTHVNDICNYIANQIPENPKLINAHRRYVIKSSDTYTLKSLVDLLQVISGVPSIVEWGVINNPRREVRELWEVSGAENNFVNKTILSKWLSAKVVKAL